MARRTRQKDTTNRMSGLPQKKDARSEQTTPAAPSAERLAATQPVNLPYLTLSLVAAALIYAFLAGFHTVRDFDIGWQLAMARWIVNHHTIPSTDVLSYTAQGKPWIYPVFSGLFFYALYSLGGYAALTWLTAAASALTTYLLTRQRTLATGILAILAVPVIATRVDPRADLFTTVLFAAVLSILWRYYRTGEGKLWLLPILFLAWVNLHWGFVAGLGLCAAYLLLEAATFFSMQSATTQRGVYARHGPGCLPASLPRS